MITKRKTVRKTASSAVYGGGKIIDAGVEAVKNTDSVDHWEFLDQIEAPMWADLSLCDLTNDETNDSWFEISHQFHQCSSSELLSTIFHPNSIRIQEPPSPKLPPSVSKSRGKNYKIKAWEQKNKPTSIKQHPVKTLTMKSSRSIGSSNNTKPTSSEAPKVSTSCESGLTDTFRPKISKSSLCSLSSQEQEKEGSAMSTLTSNRNEHQKNKGLEVSCQTSNQTSDLLTSLRNNLRRSCATRPAARVVRCSEGFKSSSRKSSVASSLDQCKKDIRGDAQNKQRTLDDVNVTRVSQPPKTKLKVLNVTKAPAQNVRSLSNKQGSNILSSKVTTKVQQHTSLGKVLMPRKVNEQCQMIDKEAEKRGDGRRTPFLSGVKKVASAKIATCQKGISSDKEGASTGHVQKNGSKKLISLKEKTNTRNRDKDTSRKFYFR